MAKTINTIKRVMERHVKRGSSPKRKKYIKSKTLKVFIEKKPQVSAFDYEKNKQEEGFRQESWKIKNQMKEELENNIKEKVLRLREIDFDKKWEEQRPARVYEERVGATHKNNEEMKADKKIALESKGDLEAETIPKPVLKSEGISFDKAKKVIREALLFTKTKGFRIKEAVKILWDRGINAPGKTILEIKAKAKKYYKAHPEKATERRIKNKKLFRKIILFKRKFVAREKAAAESMARMIIGIDHRNEEWAEKTTKIVKRSSLKIRIAREYAEINKAKLLIQLVFVLVIATIIAASISFVTAYEYSYNGRVLGVVKNQEDVLKLLDIVTVQLSKEYQAEVKIDSKLDIVFDRVISVNREIDSSEDVLRKLTYMQDMKAKGYAIFVNGKREVIVSSKSAAEKVLESVKNRYLNTSGNSEYESIGFAEDVQIQEYQTKLGRIQNQEDALKKILTGAIESKIHMVQSGETFSGIAKQYGIKSEDLRGSNPGITPERLSIGQEIVLTQSAPLITVQTVEIATYMEPIAFEITYQNTSNMYTGEQSVKIRGASGERQVVARLTKNNGFEVAKKELKSEVIKEPIKEVVLVGTKVPPPLQGSGTYVYPVSGARITTYFSRSHPAVDLAISSGTKIRAADGGTVISAGYSGSYGYVIRINHGGNRTTLYAHCSKILVKAGEKVYQGQQIGNVGSTGRSTGPHLHFELMINGVKKNPLSYL